MSGKRYRILSGLAGLLRQIRGEHYPFNHRIGFCRPSGDWLCFKQIVHDSNLLLWRFRRRRPVELTIGWP